MKALRKLLDRLEPTFVKGGKLERFYSLYEAIDTFLYTPADVTQGPTHVRDGIDLKRVMVLVVVALLPCVYVAIINTGFQANQAIAEMGVDSVAGWRGDTMKSLGLNHDPDSFLANLVYGALFFLPLYIFSMAVGGICEVLFCIIRGHEVTEGFLVTGLLFPLTLPPTIPLWQVAIGVAFGVILGKEVFGGTGRNFMNPALTGRAFLYFAHADTMTGNSIWTAVDGFSGATPLGALAAADVEVGMQAIDVTWSQAFLGTMPGSLGETSVLACLLGCVFLLATGIASWRIMLSMLLGALGLSSLLYAVGSDSNPMFLMPPHWHLVTGGFAFGLVFMATDPVSATVTRTGMWIYGALIGVMTILIRVVNPAFPEGVMLAILFGNVFAPVIDAFVVQAHVKRRLSRHAT
ncbi:MAG: NADH:ubiquinone reductase (Na(+)-transporting) subunit B [Planctomycetota bacterium]|jgi:Na+-transporting NADH:ubiquinone oxidoreductase subunit B|nr:NADH:ubiquinone reductase (Na(+)-transporting) subunit B [Planctomycetota bacterium]